MVQLGARLSVPLLFALLKGELLFPLPHTAGWWIWCPLLAFWLKKLTPRRFTLERWRLRANAVRERGVPGGQPRFRLEAELLQTRAQPGQSQRKVLCKVCYQSRALTPPRVVC